MFTGIIQHVGLVKTARRGASGGRIAVDLGPLAEDLEHGDSVAINGACLTVDELDRQVAEFDVMSETIERTTLGSLKPGDKVNLEPAMTLGGTLDGHLVQGHVDATASLRRAERGQPYVLEFQAGTELTELMVPRGSIAIDGVSLTLVDVSPERFSVALIPTTLADTTLGGLRAADTVNVETDVIGKYVVRYLERMTGKQAGTSGGVTLEKLREAGFL